jgi:DNA polymerase
MSDRFSFPEKEPTDIVKKVRRYLNQQVELGFEEGYQPAPDTLFRTPAERMEGLFQEIKDCAKCDLHRSRNQFVFGEGNPGARLIFIGEAPGRDEDLQGRPFVGRAGQLLTKMLASIDLRREEVYIGNILKCRPPNNRDPLPEEVRCCEPHLGAQLDIIRPRIICALGRIAAQTLLNTTTPLGRLRGSLHLYGNIPLLATYHPAALLRNPNWKRGAWEDLLLLRQEIDR